MEHRLVCVNVCMAKPRSETLTADQLIKHHSNAKGCATRLPCAVQDVGACMGQDTRRLITDGWGQHQIVALDLVADYWYDTSLAAMLHYWQ